MLVAACTLLALSQAVLSTTVREIQGPSFSSAFTGQRVHNVTGFVTAKGSTGFWIRDNISLKKKDDRVSPGLQIFSTSAVVLNLVAVGDLVSLSGTVAEYRDSARANDLLATEITGPGNITVISSNNTIKAVVLGKDRSPPTEELTSLDSGVDGVFSIPNNRTRLQTENLTLNLNYGLDFWESLEGELVTVPKPKALNFENQFGEYWVRGDWKVTGLNARGGLTMTTKRSTGKPDANPETIIIGPPLDGTRNPEVVQGAALSDITGVVVYRFGFYYVLPLTAPTVLSRPSSTVPATTLKSDKNHITIGDYNVENLSPQSAHLPAIADHIVNYLKTPDLVFLQEIQDNSGPSTGDGIVSANVTLSTLVAAITAASGVEYTWIEIAPEDGTDGGIPGGNIRVAYLYRSEKLSLVNGTIGGALDATKIVEPTKKTKEPTLSFNPGRLDPTNSAWLNSRKPLVANWKTASGKTFFTINVHLTSKSGSTSTQGDARPFINLGNDQRAHQLQVIADFAETILHADRSASIVMGGDCNEFLQASAIWAPFLNVFNDVDELAKVPPVERYTYVFDQNSEMLDHLFVSDNIAKHKVEVEHIHVNTWSPNFDARISDHDPSVLRIQL